MHWPSLTQPPPVQKIFLVLLLEAESTSGPQYGRKDDTIGIEPATFRLLMQFLNHPRHRVPYPLI